MISIELLQEMFFISFFLSGFSATIVLCFIKWKVFDYYELYRRPWMPKKRCEFCTGFWIYTIFYINLCLWIDLDKLHLLSCICMASYIRFIWK